MTILQIDVQAADADGNIASGSVAVPVGEEAAPASSRAASRPQERLMASIGGFGSEAITTPAVKGGTLYTPPMVTQASKSQTLVRFTGGFR